MRIPSWRIFCALSASWILVPGVALSAASEEDVHTLVEQNRQLIRQVSAQQKEIDNLRARLDRMEPTGAAERPAPVLAEAGRQIRLSGEASLAFFHSGKNGNFPNSEFGVDEAKIFVEAPIWKNVYFFGGIDLATRESGEGLNLGELYVDAENVFSSGRDRTLSLRVGRFNTPFGEEYQIRNVVDNPLISHSLADIWGLDDGIQAYGSLGRFKYNLAVQNGGAKTPAISGFDKAVTARVSVDVAPRLHFSASAMRTGRLSSANYAVSETWFANTFFRDIGSPTATQMFSADLLELDAGTHWKTGSLRAMAGWISFDDDSTVTNYARHLSYYSLEARQQLAGDLSGAVRFSGIRAPGGYPLAGQGNAGKYFYNPFAPLTTDLQRLSLGLSYHFGPPLVWKMEYSRETGHLLSGAKRSDADTISTLLGLKF